MISNIQQQQQQQQDQDQQQQHSTISDTIIYDDLLINNNNYYHKDNHKIDPSTLKLTIPVTSSTTPATTTTTTILSSNTMETFFYQNSNNLQTILEVQDHDVIDPDILNNNKKIFNLNTNSIDITTKDNEKLEISSTISSTLLVKHNQINNNNNNNNDYLNNNIISTNELLNRNIENVHNYSKGCHEERTVKTLTIVPDKSLTNNIQCSIINNNVDGNIINDNNNNIFSNNSTAEVHEKIQPEHHARRPMNAFLIFCKRHRAIVRSKHPNLENRSITKILGDWWANLEKDEKKSYTDLAKEYKDAFFSANPNFKWYKLPAPPLRTLSTRPSNAERTSIIPSSTSSSSSSVSATGIYNNIHEYNALVKASKRFYRTTKSRIHYDYYSSQNNVNNTKSHIWTLKTTTNITTNSISSNSTTATITKTIGSRRCTKRNLVKSIEPKNRKNSISSNHVTNVSMFKLADETQMGSLNNLMNNTLSNKEHKTAANINTSLDDNNEISDSTTTNEIDEDNESDETDEDTDNNSDYDDDDGDDDDDNDDNDEDSKVLDELIDYTNVDSTDEDNCDDSDSDEYYNQKTGRKTMIEPFSNIRKHYASQTIKIPPAYKKQRKRKRTEDDVRMEKYIKLNLNITNEYDFDDDTCNQQQQPPSASSSSSITSSQHQTSSTHHNNLNEDKSSRACKGKRYREFMKKSLNSPPKMRKSNNTKNSLPKKYGSFQFTSNNNDHIYANQFNHLYTNNNNSNNNNIKNNCNNFITTSTSRNVPITSAIDAVNSDIVIKDEKDGQLMELKNLNGKATNKLYEASDFDLDIKINSLQPLSLDKYLLRKRETKKTRKINSKRLQPIKSPTTIEEAKEHMMMVGSRKRKASKCNITRRDILTTPPTTTISLISSTPTSLENVTPVNNTILSNDIKLEEECPESDNNINYNYNSDTVSADSPTTDINPISSTLLTAHDDIDKTSIPILDNINLTLPNDDQQSTSDLLILATIAEGLAHEHHNN